MSYLAVLEMRKKHTSHWFHLIFTIITGGAWVVVWLICALANASHNRKIDRQIDRYMDAQAAEDR